MVNEYRLEVWIFIEIIRQLTLGTQKRRSSEKATSDNATVHPVFSVLARSAALKISICNRVSVVNEKVK
jgi:hypothetical protein